jgi:hypothetical protein
MALYKKTNITAKEGINFVRSIVETAGSLFHKIDQENDLGIDALIEFVNGEKSLNKQIALQIKSGNSYYISSSNECLIPIDSHREYWLRHPLPVFGVVYVPTLSCAYWVDITSYLKSHRDSTVIRFHLNKINQLNNLTFKQLFIPVLTGGVPNLSLQEAFTLFRSPISDEFEMGHTILFHYYKNVDEVWTELVSFFLKNTSSNIPSDLIYYMANSNSYCDSLLAKFGYDEVLKLFDFIDDGIHRGSHGQCVEEIISSLPNFTVTLKEIIKRETSNSLAQDCAALILAMHEDPDALTILESLAQSGSSYAQELVWYIEEHGEINPYC